MENWIIIRWLGIGLLLSIVFALWFKTSMMVGVFILSFAGGASAMRRQLEIFAERKL